MSVIDWRNTKTPPRMAGPYLVYMPSRDIDRLSVQYWHPIDGWSSDYGITKWAKIDPPEDEFPCA